MVIVVLSGQDLPALNMRCNPLHSGSAGSLIDRQIDAIKPKQNTRRVDHRLTLPTFCILDENIILRDTSVTDGGGCRTRTCNGSVLRRMEVLATHLICLPVYLPSHPRSLPMTLHGFKLPGINMHVGDLPPPSALWSTRATRCHWGRAHTILPFTQNSARECTALREQHHSGARQKPFTQFQAIRLCCIGLISLKASN